MYIRSYFLLFPVCCVSCTIYTVQCCSVSLWGSAEAEVWHKMHLQIVACRDCSVAERYAASYPASLPLFRLPHCNV